MIHLSYFEDLVVEIMNQEQVACCISWLLVVLVLNMPVNSYGHIGTACKYGHRNIGIYHKVKGVSFKIYLRAGPRSLVDRRVDSSSIRFLTAVVRASPGSHVEKPSSAYG